MRHLVEAVQRRTEAFEIFCRAGRRQRPQRAAVERAFEGDEAIALGMSLGGMIAARDLDRAFHRFGAGITEEHEIGKALLAQPRGELVAVRALEQVRHVPELGRLLLQRCDQMRMAMAERVDRDAGGEIEIALAIGRDQPGALAALEAEIDPGEDGKQMRRARCWSWRSLTVRPAAVRALARSHRQPVPENKTCRLFGAARGNHSRRGGDNCQPVTRKARKFARKNAVMNATIRMTEHVDADHA